MTEPPEMWTREEIAAFNRRDTLDPDYYKTDGRGWEAARRGAHYGLVPWRVFVENGYRFPSQPPGPTAWTDTVEPLGPTERCDVCPAYCSVCQRTLDAIRERFERGDTDRAVFVLSGQMETYTPPVADRRLK